MDAALDESVNDATAFDADMEQLYYPFGRGSADHVEGAQGNEGDFEDDGELAVVEELNFAPVDMILNYELEDLLSDDDDERCCWS